MFDFEHPNWKCVEKKCPYMNSSMTSHQERFYYCTLTKKERFGKCPLWIEDCNRIGIIPEPRFEKIETKGFDGVGFSVFDNYEGTLVEYLPSFGKDEYQCDKFVEFLNNLVEKE